MEKAFIRGLIAYKNGKRRENCPYCKNPRLRRAWFRGFVAMEEANLCGPINIGDLVAFLSWD